jgi:hypothetical protein
MLCAQRRATRAQRLSGAARVSAKPDKQIAMVLHRKLGTVTGEPKRAEKPRDRGSSHLSE